MFITVTPEDVGLGGFVAFGVFPKPFWLVIPWWGFLHYSQLPLSLLPQKGGDAETNLPALMELTKTKASAAIAQ